MNLIKNYGLFWRRNLVGINLGSTKSATPIHEWPRQGHLFGVGVRRRRQGFVDFAEQRGIYALYDDQFRLVYVGQAGRKKGRLYKRLRTHTMSVLSERWSRFSWFGIVGIEGNVNAQGQYQLAENEEDETAPPTKETVLDHIEAVLIAAGEPHRNRQAGRFGKEVLHYRQYKGNVDITENIDDDPESI